MKSSFFLLIKIVGFTAFSDVAITPTGSSKIWFFALLVVIEGRREQLAGKIQETYGIAKEEAENQLMRFPGIIVINRFGVTNMFLLDC